MKKPTRKCRLCKDIIDVTNGEEDFFSITKQYKKKNGGAGVTKEYYHTQCFFDYHTKEKKTHQMTEEECRELIGKYKAESEKTDKYEFTENQFHYFLMDMYSLNTLPKKFYQSLEAVYKGEYKKMKQPVSMEDLFDMWEKKKTYLLKTREQQRQRGNEIAPEGALYYDLTILIGKYDGYLEWKNKKLAEMGNESISDTSTLAQTFVPVSEMKQRKRSHVKPIKQEVDILAMLDEI